MAIGQPPVWIKAFHQEQRMGKLFDQISKTLLPGMNIPEPLRLLFEWIELRGTYVDRDGGLIQDAPAVLT